MSGQRIDDVLMLFGHKKKIAQQAYREFVIDGIKQGQQNDLVGGGLRRVQGVRNSGEYEAYGERILGSGEIEKSLWWETESDEIHVPKISLDEIMK